MTELEYINIANRVKISAALNIIRDILPLTDTSITDEEHEALVCKLAELEARGFASYRIVT